jgi:L-aminopeptidase/D-esterase-like protein
MTITWTINNLERQTSDGLVTVVHWGASAVDGDNTASIVNTLQVERGDSFTAFDQLTEQQVLTWVQDAVGKDTVEAALEQMIEAQKNPPTQSGLPWAA